MRKIRFHKYHGTGNDFIMIDNRDQKIVFESHNDVAALCHRRFGIGADGLILLEESGSFDFRMIYYNADGREGSMCGNGGRCTVAFASYLGLISGKTTFEAVDGIHEAAILEKLENGCLVTLKMQDVGAVKKNDDHYILDTGSPHYVKFVDSVEAVDVTGEGRKIRYSGEYGERGINVNFVSVKNGIFRMRTYERGVEDETWSCGTGSVAVAIALDEEGKTSAHGPVELQTPGGTLRIEFKRNENLFTDIFLTGPAIRVYEGLTEIK